MSEPFIGEIRMFGGNFAPAGWALCDGQLLPIAENDALFTLIGTTYGGDGAETFALPDLRGRIPIHMGQGPGLSSRTIGESSGAEVVTLNSNQLPIHSHPLTAAGAHATSSDPAGRRVASPDKTLYRSGPPSTTLSLQAVAPVGGSQPHLNLQPFLCINFIISLFGVFPSQT